MSEKSTLSAEFSTAAEAFQFKGPIIAIKPHGNGRIHQTLKVVSQKGEKRQQWILQRLNQKVLPDLEAVTCNIVAVTRYLSQKQKRSSQPLPLLTPISTLNGDYLYQTDKGHSWRAFEWIDGVAYETVDNRDIAHQAARVVAQFHKDLADYQGPPLATTIADFHHTAQRLKQLEKAVETDHYHRAVKVSKELAEIEANRHLARIIPIQKLPQRIVHNDPKLNNIIFDPQTDQAICLIDFDTVMPGTVLHDFGDMVRSMTNGGGEGSSSGKVFFDDQIYGAIEEGYLSVMGDTLTTVEKELLSRAGQVLAFELSVRFLTDYLAGDVYFPITRDDDNLNRSRVQLSLLAAMQKEMPFK